MFAIFQRILIAPSILLLVISAPTAAGATDEIVVSAPSRDRDSLNRQVRQFTRNVSDTADQEQFSRRKSTFCPKVIGLPEGLDKMVISKLNLAADATKKVRRAGPGCEYDTVVIFTEDGDGLVDALNSKRSSIFNNITAEKRRELFKSRKPVRWWYGTEMTGASGEPAIDGTIYRTNSSLISSGIKININSNFVIVDVNLCEGYTLDSIASYVAMVSFAQIKGDDSNLSESPSILSIFSREEPRANAFRDLTIWDRSYLQALYQIPPDRPLWQQRTRLMGAMTDAILENQRSP